MKPLAKLTTCALASLALLITGCASPAAHSDAAPERSSNDAPAPHVGDVWSTYGALLTTPSGSLASTTRTFAIPNARDNVRVDIWTNQTPPGLVTVTLTSPDGATIATQTGTNPETFHVTPPDAARGFTPHTTTAETPIGAAMTSSAHLTWTSNT